jgi:hypothetical protein
MLVPPELIEHVRFFLPADEAKQVSLPAFALVCHAWAPLVASCLYRYVVIHGKGQLWNLRKVLQARPYLRGPLTRSLEFTRVDVDIGAKSQGFSHLFSRLKLLSFCAESTSVPVLSQLARGAAETVRHVPVLQGTR